MRHLYHAILNHKKARQPTSTTTDSDTEDNSDSGYHSNRQSLAESHSPDSFIAPATSHDISHDPMGEPGDYRTKFSKTHRNVYRLSLNDKVTHRNHLRKSTASSCESLDSTCSESDNSLLTDT